MFKVFSDSSWSKHDKASRLPLNVFHSWFIWNIPVSWETHNSPKWFSCVTLSHIISPPNQHDFIIAGLFREIEQLSALFVTSKLYGINIFVLLFYGLKPVYHCKLSFMWDISNTFSLPGNILNLKLLLFCKFLNLQCKLKHLSLTIYTFFQKTLYTNLKDSLKRKDTA